MYGEVVFGLLGKDWKFGFLCGRYICGKGARFYFYRGLVFIVGGCIIVGVYVYSDVCSFICFFDVGFCCGFGR